MMPLLRLDIFGLLLSLFLLGPRQWRWSLAAAGVALAATILTFLVLRGGSDLYHGGVFTQVELGGGWATWPRPGAPLPAMQWPGSGRQARAKPAGSGSCCPGAGWKTRWQEPSPNTPFWRLSST